MPDQTSGQTEAFWPDSARLGLLVGAQQQPITTAKAHVLLKNYEATLPHLQSHQDSRLSVWAGRNQLCTACCYPARIGQSFRFEPHSTSRVILIPPTWRATSTIQSAARKGMYPIVHSYNFSYMDKNIKTKECNLNKKVSSGAKQVSANLSTIPSV